MKILHTLTFDLLTNGVPPIVDAVQADSNTRVIQATFWQGSEAVILDAGAAVSLACVKPDKTQCWYDTLPDGTKAATADGNSVSVTLAPEVMSCAGDVTACIVIHDSGGQISTFPFKIRVSRNPAAGNAISNSYYKVSTLEQINAVLDEMTTEIKAVNALIASIAAGGAVRYDEEQDPTPEQQAQAKENIGASTYYHTKREEIGVSHENINTAYIWGLYDALMAEHPDNVQKKEHTNNDGTFTNYEYVISTGEYSTDGFYQHLGEADEHIKKPKYLVESGIHGSERKTVFSTYRFVRDVLKGHNVPHAFRDGVILHILPVANPTGFDAFNYEKTNGVDINNNFDCNWTESDSHGAFPASEPETQVITKWLTDNRDAKLFIDFHNSGKVNENVAIIGTPDNEDAERVKRTALRGVDRVISYWRDVIGYPPVNAPYWNEDGTALEKDANGDLALKETPVLFSYSASMIAEGHAFGYAQNVLGIPAFVMETSSYYGDYDEWKANEQTYPPESIAMGAEALGNILIELFSETSEVVDMTEVNEKLDTILQGVSFREVKGQLVVNAATGADIIYADGTIDATTGDLIPVEGKSSLKVKLPIPNGARIVCIKADAETEAAIKKTQTHYFVQATIDFGPIGYLLMENLFPTINWGYKESTSNWNYIQGNTQFYNTDGLTFGVSRLKAGTYNWTAYYWND